MSDSTFAARIEKVVEGGLGLWRGPQGVVLIPGTLPEESVEIVSGEPKDGVRFGTVVRIIEPSQRRIEPACPLFLSCGGCDFLHTPYDHELDLKQKILAETIERIGKIKPRFLPPVPATLSEHYRYFVQLKIDEQGKIGLYRRDSHTVVPFEGDGFSGCKIQQDKLNDAIERLQGKLAGFQVIKLRMGHERFVINATSKSGTEGDDRLTGLIRDCGATGFLVNDRLIFGDPAVLYIYGEADGQIWRIWMSHDTFAQSDPSVVQKIANRVLEIMDTERGVNRLKDRMLDVFAGAGVFGILLARHVKEVIAVEIGEGAAKDCERNVTENGIKNMLAYRSTAAAFLKRFKGDTGSVIVDPPRPGLEKNVRDELIRVGAPLLFYISCQPATLARDMATFVASGVYEIDSVQMFDQFGRTHHIESLTIMKKKKQ